jgi:ferredoxin
MQCRVQVLQGHAPPDTDALAFLSQEEIRERFILACHTPVNEDLVIFIPPLS